LFVRYGDRNEIRSADSDTGGEELLITDAEPTVIFRDPQFSADGESIYYIRVDRTGTADRWSIINRNLSDGSETPIIEPQQYRLSELAVLPTGDLLLNATDPVSRLPQLFHVSLPDGERSRITNDLNSYFGISVDRKGDTIVAAQRFDERNVWVGNTSDPDSITELKLGANANLRVAWTPDGRIVYDALDNARPHIWISEADGSSRRRLTSNESSDVEAVVSPDGRYIVFTSNRTGENKIWRMSLDGSGQILLAPKEGVGDGPRLTPDGKTILFHWKRGETRSIGTVDISGGEVGEFAAPGDGYWALSPDGSKVAYVFWNAEKGRTNVAIRAVGSTEPEKTKDISPMAIFQWAADGRSILYRERQAGEIPHATIMKWRLDADEPEIFFSKGPHYVDHIAFSRDGGRMALIRGRLLTDAVLISETAQ
jgi:Tol biopolymer transport system component